MYQQDVLPGNPDVLAFHLDRQHPPLRVFRLTLVGRRTDGEVSLVINKTFESVGPEPDLVLRTEGDDHRTIPETAFVTTGVISRTAPKMSETLFFGRSASSVTFSCVAFLRPFRPSVREVEGCLLGLLPGCRRT